MARKASKSPEPTGAAPVNDDLAITSSLQEKRKFPPPRAFAKDAHIKSEAEYRKIWEESVKRPEKFWARRAKELLSWDRPFRRVLDWKPPHAKWFIGGKLNVSVNCIDRHIAAGKGNKAAIIWGRRAGRFPGVDLQRFASGGFPLCQCIQIDGHQGGRPHCHLYAFDP